MGAKNALSVAAFLGLLLAGYLVVETAVSLGQAARLLAARWALDVAGHGPAGAQASAR